MGEQRRYRQNLEGLLRLAVEHTSDADDRSASDVQPLTEERRQFLQGALSQLSGPSPTQRMQMIIKELLDYFDKQQQQANTDTDDETTERLYEVLEELSEWCEQIDLACDFHKIGGFTLLPVLQECGDPEFAWRCGDLIAALSQNNPYCQEHLLNDTDQLDRLMRLVESYDQPVLVRVKALYALSGMIRGYEQAQDSFIEKSGYEVILRAMQDENAKLRTKATFLLMNIMGENSQNKGDMTKMGCVEQLITILNREHDSSHEYVMLTLLELLTDNQKAVDEARRSDLHFKQLLEDRRNQIHGQPEYQDELDHLNSVERLVFSLPDSESMER